MGDADAEVVLWCGMLENLEISGNPEKPDLGFGSTILRYRAEVSSLQAATAVTATARLPDMTITAAGEPLQSGAAGWPIALALGETVIPVEVVHEPSGARLTYEITVRRGIGGAAPGRQARKIRTGVTTETRNMVIWTR